MSVADVTSALTPQQFADFSTFIAQHLGIKMPPSKQVMLQSRLHRRLRELGLESFAEYHERFFRDEAAQAGEIEHLLNLATTNKTDFFREPEHSTSFRAKSCLDGSISPPARSSGCGARVAPPERNRTPSPSP
jgi:chemotaxis protein methyltransferase CheR